MEISALKNVEVSASSVMQQACKHDIKRRIPVPSIPFNRKQVKEQ
jgi:hypothetical protein